MLFAEVFLTNIQCPTTKRLGLRVFSLIHIKSCQAVEDRCLRKMICPECVFIDGQSLYKERLS
jgi:hypothetical protein